MRRLGRILGGIPALGRDADPAMRRCQRANSMPHPFRLSVLLGCVLVASACSSGTTQEFDRRAASFVGRPEADLVAGFGVPSRTYDGDGRRLLQYELATPSATPAIRPSIGLGFGSWGSGVGVGTGLGFGGYGAPAALCVLVFESREGQIAGFSRNGPGCVAKPA